MKKGFYFIMLGISVLLTSCTNNNNIYKYDVKEEDIFEYSETDNGFGIVGLNSNMSVLGMDESIVDIVIPKTYKNHPINWVYLMGSTLNTAEENKIKSITINHKLSSFCVDQLKSLENVIFNADVSLYEGSFFRCENLKNVAFNGRVEGITELDGVFQSCYALENIEIQNGSIGTIATGSHKLKKVVFGENCIIKDEYNCCILDFCNVNELIILSNCTLGEFSLVSCVANKITLGKNVKLLVEKNYQFFWGDFHSSDEPFICPKIRILSNYADWKKYQEDNGCVFPWSDNGKDASTLILSESARLYFDDSVDVEDYYK